LSKPTAAATTSDSWIVMPVYNCAALTRAAVESCFTQDIGSVRLMVMDNGSTDGVTSWLRTLASVDIVSLGPPAGVTRLWNVALKHLFEEERVPYVLVINNDLRLRPDTYRLLVEDGGWFVTAVGTNKGIAWPGGVPSGEKRPHPDMSCYLIRRECWEKVGGFDERFVIYVQDLDYHLRMHQAGIDAHCIDLPFQHFVSSTLKEAGEEDRQRMLARAEKDREEFRAKWGCAVGSEEYYDKFK
jgi:GT2 family glycosyltransferase